MECGKTISDLEDGEIRDNDFEDISDCSLSDILQEGNTNQTNTPLDVKY